jgi:hypothetical protein
MAETLRLPERWGEPHAVRSALSLVAPNVVPVAAI